MLPKISVVIITKNEEKFIADAIKSSKFADEIIVLDSGSTDKTCKISKSLGAKVFFHKWLGFGEQKNKAVSLASNDWVFVLDADERITKDLLLELDKVFCGNKINAYAIPRLNYFFNKPVRWGGLFPDYSIRFFNRNFGSFNKVEVHESVEVVGEIKKIKTHMIHLAYSSVDEFLLKQKKYSQLSIKRKSYIRMIVSPVWTFLKILVLRLGFLDGWRGFVIAYVYAKYSYWKYKP